MEQRRRIEVYGLCRDGDRVLLVRTAETAPFPGRWQVPGGRLRHAEHPVDAVVREFAAGTGLTVRVTGVRSAVADVIRYTGTGTGVAVHTDRLVYDVVPVSGELRAAPAPGTDRIGWSTVGAPDVPLMPFTAEVLGLPVTPVSGEPVSGWPPGPPPEAGRRQRFGAYASATDPAGRVLLVMIADGYPGAGLWHLPGGGTDHGEQPATALLRELVEETGQLGRVVALTSTDSLHNPSAVGPEGRPLDWQGVRVVYRVVVDAPTEPRVTEAAGGSTARAGWFPTEAVRSLRMTEIAARFAGYIDV